MSFVKPEVATKRLQYFHKCFGEGHLHLAFHAAFPIALTPDLLYSLCFNFQRDSYGKLLNIPWIAVADLLLSSLCDEVGHELYEMDVVVRKQLLNLLQNDKNFGQKRIYELSNFLIGYIQLQLYSEDPDIKDLAEAQQLNALAYSYPEKAASELALAFSTIDQKNIAEILRISSLVETLAEPLAEFKSLLIYSRAMADFALSRSEDATTQFLELLQEELHLKVTGVSLPIPEQIKVNLFANAQSPIKSPMPIIGGTMVLALGVTIPAYYLLTPQNLSPSQRKIVASNSNPELTPTSPPTPSPVPTATPTLIPLPKPTQSSVPTTTPTLTPLPTKSSVPTAKPTLTPLPKPTQSSVPTATPTLTPLSTQSSVPTATPTLTPLPTQSSVPTATPTPTPLSTQSSVPTATPTPTPLPTQSSVPTATPTPTPSSTQSSKIPSLEKPNSKISLTSAVIRKMTGSAWIVSKNKPKRKAKIGDVLLTGDKVLTGESCLLDLRFNDGSLARVGAKAIFRFLPKTRRFSLSNGTALLLIPPGRGGAPRIRTPYDLPSEDDPRRV